MAGNKLTFIDGYGDRIHFVCRPDTGTMRIMIGDETDFEWAEGDITLDNARALRDWLIEVLG